MNSIEFRERQKDFFNGEEFQRFFIPLIQTRRIEHVEALISTGGDERRFRIKELDELVEHIEQLAQEKSDSDSIPANDG